MIKIRTLNCGVRVVMEKTDFLQSAAIGFWVRAGAVDEEAKYSGVSHFIEHMMFKGTNNRSAKEIAEDIDKIGGQINAFTSNETTCYYVKTLSSNLLKSTEVLLDMLTESKFDKHEMTRERQVICEEIKMTKDAPDEAAQEAIMEMVNNGNPLGKSIIGTPTTLKNISRNVIVDYIDKEYTRDSIVIAIAGNFDEEEICEYLEGKLLKFREKKEPKKHEILPYKPSYKVMIKDIEQAHLFIGTEGLKLTDDNSYKLMVLSKILGGSMSSRLFQSVRERKGLAYSVYSANSASTISGGFYIYAGVSHENIKPAIEAIKEEIIKIGRDGVTIDELNKAKEQIKAGFIFGLENVASKMFSLGKNLLLRGEVREEKEVLDIVDAITVEDVNEIAQMICDPKTYCGVAITNKRFDLKKILNN